MADVFGGPFGDYTAMGSSVFNSTSKDELALGLTEFCALLQITLTAGDGVTGSYVLVHNADSAHPDFDKIAIEMRHKIGVEMAALWDVIDAASEA